MIDWNKIEGKIDLTSVLKTFETHLNSKKIAVMREHFEQMRRIGIIYRELFKEINWSSMSATETSLLFLTYILFLTEGVLGFDMNLIIYDLMLKGHHDIWFEWKQRFVSSFDELFEVPLSVRLKFLKKHGFEFFSEICPKDLRNAIAHLNFDIDSDGTIQIKNGKKYTKKELENEVSNVLRLIRLFGKESK